MKSARVQPKRRRAEPAQRKRNPDQRVWRTRGGGPTRGTMPGRQAETTRQAWSLWNRNEIAAFCGARMESTPTASEAGQ